MQVLRPAEPPPAHPASAATTTIVPHPLMLISSLRNPSEY